jgi:hypothetical protein
MNPEEQEALYVEYSCMDTSELMSVCSTDMSMEEVWILYEATCDRREEIDQMLAALNEECEQLKKARVKLPAEIVAKLLKFEASHTSFLDDLTDSGSVLF